MAQAGQIAAAEAMAEQIRNALGVVQVEGNTVYVQVEDDLVINATPPTIDMYPGSLARETDSAGMGDMQGGYLFTVRARVSTADGTAERRLLRRFMDDADDLCIAAAIMDDETLNGYASSVSVRDPTGYTMFPDPGNEGALLGFTFTAVVLPANS